MPMAILLKKSIQSTAYHINTEYIEDNHGNNRTIAQVISQAL